MGEDTAGRGKPAALVVRREGTDEKKALLPVTSFGRVNDAISVTYLVQNLVPGKYVVALVFDNP